MTGICNSERKRSFQSLLHFFSICSAESSSMWQGIRHILFKEQKKQPLFSCEQAMRVKPKTFIIFTLQNTTSLSVWVMSVLQYSLAIAHPFISQKCPQFPDCRLFPLLISLFGITFINEGMKCERANKITFTLCSLSIQHSLTKYPGFFFVCFLKSSTSSLFFVYFWDIARCLPVLPAFLYSHYFNYFVELIILYDKVKS